MGVGEGWRRPGGAALRRAEDWKVAPDPDVARAPRRRTIYAAQPFLLALPSEQRLVPRDRSAGAGGTARARRAAAGTAGQARGGARPVERAAGRGRAAARRPAHLADRRALSGADAHAR